MSWLGIVDSLTTALVLLDEFGHIVFANQRAAELLETTPRALEHRGIAEVLSSMERLAKAGARGTCQVSLASGRTMEVGYGLSPVVLAESDAHIGVRHALTFQDITEVLRLQEERDRLLKLATVGETLPSLLHELKNPLAAVASSVELLIEEAQDAALQKDLHAILTEVRRTVLSLDGGWPRAPVEHCIDRRSRDPGGVHLAQVPGSGRACRSSPTCPLCPCCTSSQRSYARSCSIS